METSRSGASGIGEGRGASGTSNHFLNGDGNFNDAQSLVPSQTTTSHASAISASANIRKEELQPVFIDSAEGRKGIVSESGETGIAAVTSTTSKEVEGLAREDLAVDAGTFQS